MESPSSATSSMYMYAWQKRFENDLLSASRPATRIAQVTASEAKTEVKKTYTDDRTRWSASLENPERAPLPVEVQEKNKYILDAGFNLICDR